MYILYKNINLLFIVTVTIQFENLIIQEERLKYITFYHMHRNNILYSISFTCCSERFNLKLMFELLTVEGFNILQSEIKRKPIVNIRNIAKKESSMNNIRNIAKKESSMNKVNENGYVLLLCI